MKYDGKEMMDVYTKISDMNEKGYFGDDIFIYRLCIEKIYLHQVVVQ